MVPQRRSLRSRSRRDRTLPVDPARPVGTARHHLHHRMLFGPRLGDGPLEHLGRLGSGHAVAAVDDEERHTGDAVRPGLGDVGLPTGKNPVKASIPFFLWTDAIIRGETMTAKSDGIRGVEQLKTGIKFLWNHATNTLINQHSDTTARTRFCRTKASASSSW